MKLIGAVIFCGIVAYVASERCSSTRDCSHVSCNTGHDLTCHFGECTCTDYSQGTCSSKTECSGICRHNDWHCIDGHCRCGWGIGGVLGGGK